MVGSSSVAYVLKALRGRTWDVTQDTAKMVDFDPVAASVGRLEAVNLRMKALTLSGLAAPVDVLFTLAKPNKVDQRALTCGEKVWLPLQSVDENVVHTHINSDVFPS